MTTQQRAQRTRPEQGSPWKEKRRSRPESPAARTPCTSCRWIGPRCARVLGPIVERIDARSRRAAAARRHDATRRAPPPLRMRSSALAGARDVRVLAASTSPRAARLLKSAPPHVVVGAPAELVALLQSSALKAESVRAVALAWLDTILGTPEARAARDAVRRAAEGGRAHRPRRRAHSGVRGADRALRASRAPRGGAGRRARRRRSRRSTSRRRRLAARPRCDGCSMRSTFRRPRSTRATSARATTRRASRARSAIPPTRCAWCATRARWAGASRSCCSTFRHRARRCARSPAAADGRLYAVVQPSQLGQPALAARRRHGEPGRARRGRRARARQGRRAARLAARGADLRRRAPRGARARAAARRSSTGSRSPRRRSGCSSSSVRRGPPRSPRSGRR